MDQLNLKNKRILITQSALHFLAGSEITTLELATFFKTNGAEVLVFTWFYDDPIKKEFEKRNLTVITNENDTRFDNLDIAWIHHQVIPKKLLKNIKEKQNTPIFYFFHMSPLDIVPIEHPYLCDLENKISNKSFFSSEGTKESLIQLFPSLKAKSYVLENLLPNNFCECTHEPAQLKKILIVSNHPPEEVQTAASILEHQGLSIDRIGQKAKEKLITAEILTQYDLVITIGKTVVYCLGTNVPVYIYDHFGGPGYLSHKNFDKTRYRTFSGREFKKKTPEQIVKEITNNYQNAVKYQQANLESFRNLFSINSQLTNLLSEQTNSRKVSYNITNEQFNILSDILGLVYSKLQSENILLSTQSRIESLEKMLEQSRIEYEKIINSKKYKFLSKISSLIH